MAAGGATAGGRARAAGPRGRVRPCPAARLAAPLALTGVLTPFRGGLPNTDAALALVLIVVAVAAAGYRLAGMLAAVSAAVWFDFFLTVPYERFTITRAADIETTALVLAVGVAATEIAVWRRRLEAAAAAGRVTWTGSTPLSGRWPREVRLRRLSRRCAGS